MEGSASAHASHSSLSPVDSFGEHTPTYAHAHSRTSTMGNGVTLIDHVSTVADIVASSTSNLDKVAGLLMIMTCADRTIRGQLSSEKVLLLVLNAIKAVRGNVQIVLLALVKQLSEDPDAMETLKAVGTLQRLVPMLSRTRKREDKLHAVVLILEIVTNMAQYDQAYFEALAVDGMIPCLCSMAYTYHKQSLLSLVLPLLFSISYAGRKSRQELWKNDAPNLYVNLLYNEEWQQKSLEALITWLASDSRIEDFLCTRAVLHKVIACLTDRATLFTLCPLLLLLCHRSPKLNIAMSTSDELWDIVMGSLDNTDPSNLLSILRFIDLLYQYHPTPKKVVIQQNMVTRLTKLTMENIGVDMVMVKDKASTILKSIAFNTVL